MRNHHLPRRLTGNSLKSGSNGIGEQFFRLADGGGAQFAVHALGAFNECLEFRQGLFGRGQGFLSTAEFLVRKIAGEGGAGPADAETPSFKCRALVGEPGQIFL